MKHLRNFLVFTLVLSTLGLGADDDTFVIGDKAPKLAIGDWVKGEAVESFAKDKIYVVEFWATWCGPCIVAIPHLSKLQKTHPEITFIGVNVWEEDRKKAKAFVKKMGDKMDYRVAIQDGRKMETAWLTPAGQDGIPCSFVIDGEGKLAWVGHPMRLDKILPAILSGDFDAEAVAKQEAKAMAMQRKIGMALQAENWDKALGHIDESLADDENLMLLNLKFQILLKQKEDVKAAYDLARTFPVRFKDDSELLNEAAWFIVDEEGLKKRDLKLAKKMAEQAVKLSERKAGHILDTLARVYAEQDDLSTAMRLQEEAVSVAEDEMKDDLKQTLEGYIIKSAL